MRPDLNGTNTPATDSLGTLRAVRLENETNLKENFPAKFQRGSQIMTQQYKDLYFNVESPKTAPVFGELSNLKPPMYIDFDPNIKSDQKGIIYISVTYTDTPTDLRHTDARHTAYDSKNDPAWHYTHGIASFDVLRIVKTAVVPFAVKSLNDLNLVDDSNESITHDWFVDMMALLNGKKSFEGISARNTSKFIARRQKKISESPGLSQGKLLYMQDKLVINDNCVLIRTQSKISF